MSKTIRYILAFLFAVASIVGMFLCGIHTLNMVFKGTGSYVIALTGFLMSTCGGIIAKFINPSND